MKRLILGCLCLCLLITLGFGSIAEARPRVPPTPLSDYPTPSTWTQKFTTPVVPPPMD